MNTGCFPDASVTQIYFSCFYFPVVETVVEGGGDGDSGKLYRLPSSIPLHPLPSYLRQTFMIPVRAE